MGTATVAVTGQNFQEHIDRNGILILDFWASWCGPCRQFAPIFERSALKHPEIVFGKVNTDEEQEMAAAFEIRSIPTVMIFRERVLVFEQPGMLPDDVLEEIIGKVLALDMDAVRAEIAARTESDALPDASA